MSPLARHPRRHRGVSLIEVLVGILIISFGLLGLITLQGRALQVAVSSEDSQRAALLADELAATMFNAGTVSLPVAVTDAWAARVADPASGGLPSGVGAVTAVSASTARITINWTPPQVATAASASTPRYVTDVVVPPL